MKRGKPPKRTPLVRKPTWKPLKRTPLKRRRTKKAQAHVDRMVELRPLVFARDGYRCRATALAHTCAFGLYAHHVWPTGSGGPDELWNLLTVCGVVHPDMIHVTRKAEALALGLLARNETEARACTGMVV